MIVQGVFFIKNSSSRKDEGSGIEIEKKSMWVIKFSYHIKQTDKHILFV